MLTSLVSALMVLCLYNFYHWICFACLTQSPSFWVMARGVRDFVRNKGSGNLPVRGIIPDMIADSDKFIKLQNVYVFLFLLYFKLL